MGESATETTGASRISAINVEPQAKARAAEEQPLIEDHALIGDLGCAALVTRGGRIDWLCVPRFDSPACFCALLGSTEHGHWTVAPRATIQETKRRYRQDTLVLETEWTTETGTVRLVDFMPPHQEYPKVVRIVEGVRGKVSMRSRLHARFGYGQIRPQTKAVDDLLSISAGPDALYLSSDLSDRAPTTTADFEVRAGDRISFVLAYSPSHLPPPRTLPASYAERETMRFWLAWVATIKPPKHQRDLVVRSLITLKACIYEPTGGIAAAPTTSLPETMGGERNWDYRFCWLRDASLTLMAFERAGLSGEARAFGAWIQRALAGDPKQFQIMYGLAGERRLTELTLDWLPGYGGSKPVRIGNGAFEQFQLDIFGEIAGAALLQSRSHSVPLEGGDRIISTIADVVIDSWRHEDKGIWEMRGPNRSFTASKVSAWYALDCCIRIARERGLDVPLLRWEAERDMLAEEILSRGFDKSRNSFTQYYGSKDMDASLLFITYVGILPSDDPRVIGTVEAVEKDLLQDGFLLRYVPQGETDGLHGKEGAFLACSFWLVRAYMAIGRRAEAEKLFERLVGLCNDVGLLAEEYDPIGRRQLGNFPQAFSHLALIQAAYDFDQDQPSRTLH